MSGHIAWKDVSTKTVADYGIFSVTERLSIGPHGREGRFVVLDAPEWAVVVPVLERGGGRALVTVRQYRHGLGRACVEFPGGVVERGEDPATAAARELLEETGYRAGRIVALGSPSPNPAFMANRLHVFVALDLESAGEQSLDEHEFVDVDVQPEDRVLAAVGDPPWDHALMTAAAWYYRRWLEKGRPA